MDTNPFRPGAPAPALPRRADALALGVLLGLSLLYYPDLAFRGLILADFDAFVYFYPLRAYAAEAIRQGHLPLWNPYQFLGSPFLANPQTAVFYPPTGLFSLLPIPYAYSASLVLHLWLAGAAFYLFGRKTLGLAPLAGLFGALAFMFSAFFAGQAGHLNQFSAAAWMPLVVAALDQAARQASPRWAAAGALAVGAQALAGHPQESYITLVVAAAFVGGRVLLEHPRRLPLAVGMVAGAVALGVGLAGVQLLPTLHLTSTSIRAGGLEYQEASFLSLPPWFVPWSLLPGFRWNVVDNTEYMAYVGVVPLVAALLALAASRRVAAVPATAVALLGFSLAMGDWLPVYAVFYEWVPLFDRFRVPARWLLAYEFGMASLAGLGFTCALQAEWPWRRANLLARAALVVLLVAAAGIWALQFAEPVRLRLVAAWAALALGGALGLTLVARSRRFALLAAGLVVALTAAELWLAPRELAYLRGVPADAYASGRETTRFLHSAPDGRLLSVALDHYDLREAAEIRERYAWLGPQGLLNYQVALKLNEVLAPNLPTLYRLPAVDGYDGGVLPLERFVELSRIVVPPDAIRRDGVWRASLEHVPSRRLLDLLGVRYALAARIRDASADGIPYDRGLAVPLRQGERRVVRRLPAGRVTGVGVVTTFDGPPLPAGTEVGALWLVDRAGGSRRLPIRLGIETGVEREPETAGLALPLERWFVEDRWDYATRFRLPPMDLSEIALEGSADQGVLVVKAVTLLDADGETAHALVLDDGLERRVLHELKIYEVKEPMPFAYVAQRSEVLDDAEALERLAQADFDPRRGVVLGPGETADELAGPSAITAVAVQRPTPERILASVELARTGYLVVLEANTPGWRAVVDGRPAEVLRANYLFQAVRLAPGAHEVELVYEQPRLRLGGAVSGASLIVVVALASLSLWPRGWRGAAREAGDSPRSLEVRG